MAYCFQNKYCPTCKKTTTDSKNNKDLCKKCGTKLKKGTWAIQFYYVDDSGTRKFKKLSGYEKKFEAEAAYTKFVFENGNNEVKKIGCDNLTFSQLYKEYETHMRLSPSKESSDYGMIRDFENHILPFFGNKQIKDIKKKDVFNWQETLSKKQYAYNTKAKLRSALYAFFSFLEDKYDIDNIVRKVRGFKQPEHREEMQIYSHDEFICFLNVIDDITYKTLFMLLYYTGCRIGEALALQWEDIDLNAATVAFTKTYTRKLIERNAEGYKITPPKKSGSSRRIVLPHLLCEQLKKYKEQFYEGFVFQGQHPLPEQTIRNRQRKYTDLAGVKYIRLHDFRHSHASLILSLTHDIVLTSKRLGHKNPQITLERYSHLMPNSEAQLIEKIDLLD